MTATTLPLSSSHSFPVSRSPAAPHSPAASQSVADVSRRLTSLLDNSGAVAQWWVDLAAELDELSDRLMLEGHTVWQALRHQLTVDAPHLTSHLSRLDSEQERLQGEIQQVRLLTGSAAGDPESAGRVRTAVRDLLRRLRRHEERTTSIMYDAYERDLGGESA